MATHQKSVLILGLKHAGPQAPFSDDALAEMIQGEINKFQEAGFHAEESLIPDPENYDFDPLRKLLRSRQWTVVTIGFGVRGEPKYTALFEKLVNAAIEEVNPTPKLSFQHMPNKIVEAVDRVLATA